jgi:hypothetical protein
MSTKKKEDIVSMDLSSREKFIKVDFPSKHGKKVVD